MTRYFVNVDDKLATRLKTVDDERIVEALESLVEAEAPPADEVDHEELSEAERKRREIRRIRRRGSAAWER